VADRNPDKSDLKGHRERLRARFSEGGADALPDYEILELLLFGLLPQRDTKPVAKALLHRFGSIAGVLGAEPAALQEIDGIKDASAIGLKAVQAAALRMLRDEAMVRPVIGSWDKLLDYCKASMAHEPREQLRILFLDRKNKLVRDEVQQTGTVDHTPLYPREVAKRALELDASAVILVHNHPSGDPTPSRTDIDMTVEVEKALGAVSIKLHDHLVIGRDGHASFKALGLI